MEIKLAMEAANELSTRYNWERPDEYLIKERLKVLVEAYYTQSQPQERHGHSRKCRQTMAEVNDSVSAVALVPYSITRSI